MSLYLKNSLTGRKDEFTPLDFKMVKMYVCGPTVYDLIHIGNARSLVVYDILYRLLRHLYGADRVLYVRNITDVDDKINARAKELQISITELTQATTLKFHEDARYLNCLPPNIEPRATQHIPRMIDIIQRLLDNKSAYVKNGTVYFSITSYQNYGKLSGRKVDELISGARVEIDKDKYNPGDFVLWKPADSNDHYSSVFPSPWGNGQPGWHIECSAMAYEYLGTDFDIHGGGVDLIFPHHTNEIAQSCCAFPESRFARYWVHNGFLKVNGEKMSKSLNNFLTVQDMRAKGISGDAMRYALINTHYHKPLDFHDKALHEAKENVNYLTRVVESCDIEKNEEIFHEFLSFLQDDLNTHGALNYLLGLAKKANISQDARLRQSIKYCTNFLGLCETQDLPVECAEIEELVQKRTVAKQEKNWLLADQIRDELKDRGVALEDNKNGETLWRKL